MNPQQQQGLQGNAGGNNPGRKPASSSSNPFDWPTPTTAAPAAPRPAAVAKSTFDDIWDVKGTNPQSNSFAGNNIKFCSYEF